MDDDQKKIEVCFSPAVFDCFHNPDAIVIVVDVLRASTAICTAFMNGVGTIIPVSSANEAREYKHNGYIVAAERDGHTLDFADFGNSPFNFTSERIFSKTIVYSTTNGTQAINMASSCYKVAVGSFINLRAMCNWILNEKKDVIILCAGWKNRFSLEDTILAGAIAERLLESQSYYTECDSAHASLDLWSLAKNDIIGYIQKAAQRTRLRKNGLDDVIEFCFTPDLTDIIPVYSNGMLVKLREPVAFVN
jgi:Phosphosulfolactate phosphohydrolase and related enzymes